MTTGFTNIGVRKEKGGCKAYKSGHKSEEGELEIDTYKCKDCTHDAHRNCVELKRTEVIQNLNTKK